MERIGAHRSAQAARSAPPARNLLYQAIGAGNLRAYADTDAIGHVALAN
jgi:hypothetical protein